MSAVSKKSDENIELDFEKIKFERAFQHLSSLATEISIGVAVQTLVFTAIIGLTAETCKDETKERLAVPISFFCGRIQVHHVVFFFLACATICVIFSIVLSLIILSRQVRWEDRESVKQIQKKIANGQKVEEREIIKTLSDYVAEAIRQKCWRRITWCIAIVLTIMSIIFLALAVVAYVFPTL